MATLKRDAGHGAAVTDEIVLAMTGASGARYFTRAFETLEQQGFRIHLLMTETAEKILRYETGLDPKDFKRRAFAAPAMDDYFSATASGSHKFRGMLILPSSMNTVGCIANGVVNNLVVRTADVCLKERRPLVIGFREAPLNLIHLRNLTTLAEAGAVVFPAAPGFYGGEKSIQDLVDQVVGKALDQLSVEHRLYKPWKES